MVKYSKLKLFYFLGRSRTLIIINAYDLIFCGPGEYLSTTFPVHEFSNYTYE